MKARSLGFIGFGEAAFHIAKGLRSAGLEHTFAYDIQRTSLIEARAVESATTLVKSPAELAESSDTLFSLVTAHEALEAASEMAPFMTPNHVFVDLNSISPASKRLVEAKISEVGAAFVEGAIMAPVPPHGHTVPILLTGRAADKLSGQFFSFGMNLKAIEGNTGAAAAVKMCRSIVVKGLEALLFECTRAASVFGAEKRVFESLTETFPGMDWEKLASYMIGRVVVHGERRAHEMEEVAETLRAIHIEPVMAEATAEVQAASAYLNLKAHFGPEGPKHYREVMEILSNE